MNLCSGCLAEVGIRVKHPQLLKFIELCDGCREKKKSYDIITIVEQTIRSK